MKVNEKFPNWMTSGGNTPDSFTGFISNVVFPYFYAQDKPTFRYSYSTNVFPSITVGTAAQWLSSLDVMFAMRFGERTLRKIVEPFNLHNDSTKSVTSENMAHTNILAQMINERFADKWNHIADALGLEYNPLENYDRTEDTTITDEGGKDGSNERSYNNYQNEKSISGGYSDEDTRGVEKGGKVKTERDTRDNIHGFNTTAIDGVPADYQKMIETVEYDPSGDAYSETNSGSIERTYNQYKETEKPTGTYKDEYGETNGNERTIDSSIHGNIGVTSSQQMLTQEIEVRRNLLYDIVLNDIAEFLTISIY